MVLSAVGEARLKLRERIVKIRSHCAWISKISSPEDKNKGDILEVRILNRHFQTTITFIIAHSLALLQQ